MQLRAPLSLVGLSLAATIVSWSTPAHAGCGGNGDRPCNFWERIPSCDPDLVEWFGACRSPHEVGMSIEDAIVGGGESVAGTAVDIGDGVQGVAVDAGAFLQQIPQVLESSLNEFRTWDCGEDIDREMEKAIAMLDVPRIDMPAPYDRLQEAPQICAKAFSRGLACSLPSLLQDNVNLGFEVARHAESEECQRIADHSQTHNSKIGARLLCGFVKHMSEGLQPAIECMAAGMSNGAFFGLGDSEELAANAPDAAVDATLNYIDGRCELKGELVIDMALALATGGTSVPATAARMSMKVLQNVSKAQQIAEKLDATGSCGTVDVDMSASLSTTSLPSRIAIMGRSGHVLSANPETLDFSETEVDDDNIFEVESLGEGKVALRTVHGRYLVAASGGGGFVGANLTEVNFATAFVPVKAGPNGVAFRTASGHYLRALQGGGTAGQHSLDAEATEIGDWERFSIISMDRQSIFLQNVGTGNTVTAEGTSLRASERRRRAGSRMTLVRLGGNRVALQLHDNTYLSAVAGGDEGFQWGVTNIGGWETFEMERVEHNRFVFKTADKGRYLTTYAADGLVAPTGTLPLHDEQFHVIDARGSTVSIMAPNGKWLCANDGGGAALTADRNIADRFERFDLVKSPTGDVSLRTHDGHSIGIGEDGFAHAAGPSFEDGAQTLRMTAIEGGFHIDDGTGQCYLRMQGPYLYCDTDPSRADIFKVSTEGTNHQRLSTFWSSAREDNATVANPISIASTGGYAEIRVEGWLPSDAAKDIAPLDLYWSPSRQDNVLVSTEAGRGGVNGHDYVLVRREGYVHTSPQPGTVPLELWWSPEREDNMSVATEASRQSVIAEGYEFIRIQGYVYPH